MIGRIILLSLFAICVIQAFDQWAFQVKYHDSINFSCSSQSKELEDFDQLEDITWILPSEQLVRAESLTTGLENVKLLNNGTELLINDVDKEDFGVYYCIAKLNGESWVIRKGLNVNGPYFGDLLAKYSSNAKTGAIAACITFLIIGSICFMYDRNQEKGERELAKAVLLAKRQNFEIGIGIVNPAMDMTEVEYENTFQPSDKGKVIQDDVDTHF